jgi:hypothetical protein
MNFSPATTIAFAFLAVAAIPETVTTVRAEPRTDALKSQAIYGVTLATVAEVQVETEVGILPRLPLFLTARCEETNAKLNVRVVWPAPTDNAQVLKPGTYTIVGRILGSEIHPTVIVRVRAESDKAAPTLSF